MNAYTYLRERYNRACEALQADNESENAQAAREVASLQHRDNDPEPGAFYGHADTAPEPEPTHA